MSFRTTMAALVALALAGPATRTAAAAPPGGVHRLRAKNGDVTFRHATHRPHKCDRCHRSSQGKIPELHSGDRGKSAHALCRECHEREAKGPQKCPDCHVRKTTDRDSKTPATSRSP